MRRKNDFTIPATVIVAVMIMSLVYFWFYRSGMTGFNIQKPLSLTKEEFTDMALLDLEHLPDNYSFNQSLLLVNNSHTLPDDFVADISFYKTTDVPMNNIIQSSYASLSSSIMDRYNNKLYVSSAYRSHEHQAEVYEEEGPDVAALPGTSEHETGLALDVYVMYYAGTAFINCDEGRYVNENCGDYGFIIRYPAGSENITGFEYECWHIRYVGQPHATLISDSGITLEEYIDYYEVGSYYSCDGYLIGRFEEDQVYVPAEYVTSTIRLSPDNCGNIFVTIEK